MPLAQFVRAAAPKKASVGARGKWAETEVRKVLQGMSDADLHFCFNRTLDARSAGGRFPAQAGDFQSFKLYRQGLANLGDYSTNGLIEVKEVEHAFRLPFKNLDEDSYARMHKRELAGSRVLVLIAHRWPDTKPSAVVWRALPLSYFADRSKVKGVGSWDLSAVPVADYRQAILNFL